MRAVEAVAGECGNHAVAACVHVSEKTVRNHVSALLLELPVAGRPALVLAGREAGLGAG